MNTATKQTLPHFSKIVINEIPQTLQQILSQNQAELNYLLQNKTFTWGNLMQPLDSMNDRLHHFWSLISHMNAVINSSELRKVYNECLPKLSDYYTSISHNTNLYKAIESLTHSPEYAEYDQAQKKVLEHQIRDFKLAGVALPEKEKKHFAMLSKSLSELTTKFEENVLDATASFNKLITAKEDLAGIPEHAILAAHERAKKNNQTGWLFTLEMPSYLAIIMHAESRSLRETFYQAYVTRASDQSPTGTKWDNSPIMHDILSKRLELAKLLQFNNYAELSLATKMANSPTEVLAFLTKLAETTYPKAKEEFSALTKFAKNTLNLDELQPWDISFAAEKLRQHEYDLSQEALRPYFKEENVLTGLFTIINRLFNVTLKPVTDFDSYHPDVRLYAVQNELGNVISYCYVDLHARPNKRGGAWMDDCQIRRLLGNNEIQIPIAFVTCNFNGPNNDMPAVYSHDEVLTLFHEFGHALQHMLTTVNYADVSGINGIPWDAVELPSQFLENWAWEKESLMLFAKHYKTGKPLPDELYKKLHKAKNFQAAMQMLRQLEFALFDFILHMKFNPNEPNQIQDTLNQVREKISVIPIAPYNRFQNGFSHIFAGGYAAGYYCYKWAEVMASDAFSLFLEKGIFDQETSHKFLTYILQPGGSEEPAILFKKFRSHEPRIEALLIQSGILENESK